MYESVVFPVCKQMINVKKNISVRLQYMKPFNWVQNKWALTRLKIKLPANYSFINHLYKNKIYHSITHNLVKVITKLQKVWPPIETKVSLI